MACKIASPGSTVQRQVPALPQTIPSNPAQLQSWWSSVVQSLNEWGRSIQGQQGQSSANVIPAQYAIFAGSGVPPFSLSNCTAVLDNTYTLYGSNALKVSASATGATLEFSGYPIILESAQKWYVAFHIYSSSDITGSLEVITSAGHSITETFSVTGSSSYQTVWALFDFRQYSDNKATWKFTFNTVSDFWIDGLQMNAVGAVFLAPSAYAITQAPGNMDQVPDTNTRFAAAEAGADVTGNHTSNDTANVNGTAAATVSQGAGRANAAIDSGNVVITTALDFSRAYTNKNGVYLPRTSTDSTPLSKAFTKANVTDPDDVSSVPETADILHLKATLQKQLGQTPSNQDNLLYNGDFSQDAFWTINGTDRIWANPGLELVNPGGAYIGSTQLDERGNTRHFKVEPGDYVSFGGDATLDSGSGTFFFYLAFYDSTFTLLTSGAFLYASAITATGTSSATGSVPTGAAYCTFVCSSRNDATAHTWTVTRAYFRIGSATIADPGAAKGYVDLTDTTANGHNWKGSVPPIVGSGSVSYTSTATSVTFSWSGIAALLADGSSLSLPDESGYTYGSLTASTQYTFACYYDVNADSYTFLQDSGASLSLAHQQAMIEAGHIEIFTNTITTPSSGGSGGGGGSGLCVAADSLVLMGDGSLKRARDIRRGDLIEAWKHGEPLGPMPVLNDPEIVEEECMTVLCGERVLTVSTGTDFYVPGSVALLRGREIDGEPVLTDSGWRNATTTGAGRRPVVHISLGQRSFAASDPGFRGWIVSHNLKR